MTTLTSVRHFLGLKRIAVVGVSRNSHDFTRALLRELQNRQYDVVPVHPSLNEIDGQPCYAHVGDIHPPVEGALLLTAPPVSEHVVRECLAAGIHAVWLYRGALAGAASLDAVAFCRANNIDVVDGECPFMFLPDSGWIHGLHGFCRKVTGRYPKN